MNKVTDLKNKIKKLQEKISTIQAECNHPKSVLDVKHRGSTGGWDADTYWIEYTCGLCEKFWTEDKE